MAEAMRTRRARPTWVGPPPPGECALAAGLTAVMCADLGQASSVWFGLALVLPAGLSLAWRLRAPWVPLLGVCAANLTLLATAPGEFGPQTVVIGALVAVYTAAAHLTRWSAAAAGAYALAMLWAAHVVTPEGHVNDFLPFVTWGVPWLAGRLVRRQTLAAREAGARAALAEIAAAESAAAERDRIARELHDVVAHSVSVMVVQAGAERMRLQTDAPATREVLTAIETSGRQALGELRTMLGVLRSPDGTDPGAPQPDLTALPALVEAVRSAGLPVELSAAVDPGVPPGIALAAYRVVQESLTNALRHAGPVPTTVTLTFNPDLRVEVCSELRSGSEVWTAGSGRGLAGLRERVELHGGRFDAGRVGAQWRVTASLPLNGRRP
jgi:signal transduction histidine kinase